MQIREERDTQVKNTLEQNMRQCTINQVENVGNTVEEESPLKAESSAEADRQPLMRSKKDGNSENQATIFFRKLRN